MPLADVYFKRASLGFPWVSVLFFLNCILVSGACAMDTGLYGVFAARAPMTYPWTVVTTLFVHGWPGMTMFVHLGGNMLVLLTVGIMVERLLGPTRMICLSIFGASLFMLPIAISGGGGIGASWAVFPFGFVTLAMLIMEYKRYGRAVLKDPVFHAMAYALFLMWVFSVGLVASMVIFGWGGANLLIRILLGIAGGVAWHLFPNLVGLIFALVWRKKIRRRMKLIWANKNWPIYNRYTSDRAVIGVMGGILCFNFVVLVLAVSGIIPY